MCVAIYKPQGVQTPSRETLKRCWEANPDGAGFAIRTGGNKYAIEIKKGFMSWESFEAAFQRYRLADFSGAMFLHFRIATHGGVSPGNTHPFCITQDMKLLRHTDILTNYALIHNGILPIEPETAGISDTMEFCRRLARGKFYQNIPEILQLLEGLLGSNKLAIMTRTGVHLAGHWKKLDGVYFSNMLWRQYFNWNWNDEDEPCFPDESELRLLRKGTCPDCSGKVVREGNEFYCLECDRIWRIRSAFADIR